MLCDGKLYCDLLDWNTHEVFDSVEVREGQDIVFQPMKRTCTVAIQFRWSPLLAAGPQRLTPDDQFLINDGAWGIHRGSVHKEFWDYDPVDKP